MKNIYTSLKIITDEIDKLYQLRAYFKSVNHAEEMSEMIEREKIGYLMGCLKYVEEIIGGNKNV